MNLVVGFSGFVKVGSSAKLEITCPLAKLLKARLNTAFDKLLVVELHPTGSLVLDPVPESLEPFAVQHGLPRTYVSALATLN